MKPELNGWTRRGKKYKAECLSALKQLYGKPHADTECQKEVIEENTNLSNRTTRTDSVCDVAP